MRMDYLALLPEILVLAGAVTTLLAGSFLPRRRQWVTRVVAVVALAAAATLGAIGAGQPVSTVFDGSYALDAASATARILVPVATLLVLLLGTPELNGAARESETYTLLLLGALGTMVLAGANDMLLLATGYLLASIPLYAIIGISRSARAAEAALKTYLLGALLGVTMLLGIVVLVAVGGASDYGRLAPGLAGAPRVAVIVGVVAVVAGLLFKAGGVPGHFWVPDATQAAERYAAAFLTTIPKIGALLAAFRLATIMPASIDMPLFFGIAAALSMTVGNFAAFWQRDVRRLLGWSTVSQVGYLLLPVAVAGKADLALPSLVLYLAAYTVTNLTAFAVVAALPGRAAIGDWAGAARSHPYLVGSLVVALLGLVGTPPTAVFFGKLTTFSAAWDGGLAWLVVIAAVNTVASLFYYLRWLASAFHPHDRRDAVTTRWAAAIAIAGAITALALGAASQLALASATVGLAS